MRHALKPEWIKAENLDMEGLVRRMVWERVSLQSHEKVFSPVSTIRSSANADNLVDILTFRLAIQGQHKKLKDDTGKGDFKDAFSPVPHCSISSKTEGSESAQIV
jgi:hypothetical protein